MLLNQINHITEIKFEYFRTLILQGGPYRGKFFPKKISDNGHFRRYWNLRRYKKRNKFFRLKIKNTWEFMTHLRHFKAITDFRLFHDKIIQLGDIRNF